MSKQSTTQVGLGCFSLLGLLQIAFVVLRLCGVIQWSWWWVLAPMWIYGILNLFVFVVLFIIEDRRSRLTGRDYDRVLDRRLAKLREQQEEMERERREEKNSANEG